MTDYNNLFHQILEELNQEIGDNPRIEVSEKDGYVSLKLANSIDYNVKNKIANYKKNLDMLDDCIFIDVLDELATYHVNLKQFDELLNKEELSESEEIYVLYLINFTNSLIRQHILNKIKDLNELVDKF